MEPSNIKNLSDIYNSYKKNLNNEIEARFGIFDKNFIPGINYEQYTKVYWFLKNNTSGYKKETIEQDIKIYADNVKEINGQLRKKEKIEKFDIEEYGVRIAISKEIQLDSPYKKGKVLSHFKRTRVSFIYENIRFDIDFFNDSITIEVESKLPSFDGFMKNINSILYILQDSEILISKKEEQDVFNYYKKTFSNMRNKFIGVQPEIMSLDRLSKNISYAFTKKLDGKRFVLLCFNKNLYLMSNNMRDYKKLPYTCQYKDFLIDGEYFNRGFYAFDLIYPDTKFLKKRLDVIKDIFSKCEKYNEQFSTRLQLKPYTFGDFYQTMQKMITTLRPEYEDGIIVIKTNTNYKNSLPLKWKKLKNTTIDFLIKKKKDNVFEFYVQDYDNKIKKFAENKVDSYNLYAENDIVECYWDNAWIPVKHRKDKLKPNFITVAENTWKYIQDPLDIDVLKDFFNNKPHFFNMRRYHNYIKRYLIEDISKGGEKLLDLACGKGGDFKKYVDNGIKYVECYEINKDSITEAERRIEQFSLQKKITTEFKIIEKDINKGDIKTSNKFDLVVCNFAVHYFYKDIDNLISFIRNITNPGAKLLFTLFDSKNIKEYNSENAYIKKINEEEIEVFVKDSVLDKPTKEYIVDIDVFINKFKENGFSLNLNKDFKDFYKDWSSKTKNNILSPEEKVISFMNTALIFQKN